MGGRKPCERTFLSTPSLTPAATAWNSTGATNLSLLRGAGSAANWKTTFYHVICCTLAPCEKELWWACCDVGLRWHQGSPCSAESSMPVCISTKVMRGETACEMSQLLMNGEDLNRTPEASHFLPEALYGMVFQKGGVRFSPSLCPALQWLQTKTPAAAVYASF